MDKLQLLNEVRRQVGAGMISRDEVMSTFGEQPTPVAPSVVPSEPKGLENIKISQILSYVGAFIVFLGIVVLIVQNWQDMGLAGRILVTLGAGVVAYLMGAMFGMYEKMYQASQAFYLLSGFLLPVGLAITLDEYTAIEPVFMQVLITGLLFVLFLASMFVAKRKDVFVIYSIIYATWFIYAVLIHIIDMGTLYFEEWKVFAYLTLFVGMAYVALGYRIKDTEWSKLTSWLYAFGVLGILTSTISLGGVWDLLFAGVVLGVMFLSVYLKSRSFLVFGTLFVMIYIGKLTVEYFADMFSWPIALVVAGLALIGAGYGAFYLNEKYISKEGAIS